MAMACWSASFLTAPAASPFGSECTCNAWLNQKRPFRASLPRSCAALFLCRSDLPAALYTPAHLRPLLIFTPAPGPTLARLNKPGQLAKGAPTLTRVYDSGSLLETISAAQLPALFNSEGTSDSKDSRSDNKGPEPEGLVSS